MLNSIIAFLMSIIISLSGTLYGTFGSLVNSFFEMFYGIPYTAEAIKDDFLSEIGFDDIGLIDEETGYVKDTLAVFVAKGVLVVPCYVHNLYKKQNLRIYYSQRITALPHNDNYVVVVLKKLNTCIVSPVKTAGRTGRHG